MFLGFVLEYAMKQQTIYKIINIINNKFYVGSTTDTKSRFRVHRARLRANTHHSQHLQAAWNKYGEEAFVFVVVQIVPPENSLQEAEDVWLAEHVGKDHCYNLTRFSGAPWRGMPKEMHPAYGHAKSDATIAKLSESTKRQWAIDDPRTGKKHSDEVKAKIAEKVQQAVAEGRGGKFIPSDETRKKMSEALKGNTCALGYKRTDEEKEKIAQRMKGNKLWLGKTHSEESKLKMSRQVRVTHADGTEKIYASITQLRQETGISPGPVNAALKSGKPISRGKFVGWVFKYLDQPST